MSTGELLQAKSGGSLPPQQQPASSPPINPNSPYSAGVGRSPTNPLGNPAVTTEVQSGNPQPLTPRPPSPTPPPPTATTPPPVTEGINQPVKSTKKSTSLINTISSDVENLGSDITKAFGSSKERVASNVSTVASDVKKTVAPVSSSVESVGTDIEQQFPLAGKSKDVFGLNVADKPVLTAGKEVAISVAVVPITGGSSILWGAVNVGAMEGLNFLPRIPIINPNPTGKFNTNPQAIATSFLEGELIGGAFKAVGAASGYLAEQDIPVLSKGAQIAQTLGQKISNAPVIGDVLQGIGKVTGRLDSAVPSVWNNFTTDINFNFNIDTTNLSNRFLNRFFPDWKEPITIDLGEAPKPTQVYDMYRSGYSTWQTGTSPESLSSPDNYPTLNYNQIKALPNIPNPIVNDEVITPKNLNIDIFGEPTPKFNPWIETATQEPKIEPTSLADWRTELNSWGYEKPSAQPLLQEQPNLVAPRQTTYLDPSRFQDAEKLLRTYNTSFLLKNTDLAVPQNSDLEVVAQEAKAEPTSLADWRTELNSWGFKRTVSTSTMLKPLTDTDLMEQIQGEKKQDADFLLALGFGALTQPETQTQTQPQPFGLVYPAPISITVPASRTQPFVQPNPLFVTNPQPEPQPEPEPQTLPQEFKQPIPPEPPYLFPGFKYEPMGWSYTIEKRSGLKSQKRLWPILSAKQFANIGFDLKQPRKTKDIIPLQKVTTISKSGTVKITEPILEKPRIRISHKPKRKQFGGF